MALDKLEGTLLYVMVDQARDCWDKEKGKEWKAQIAITNEDVVDEFDKLFSKQAAKKVKSSAFEEEFNCPLPEGAGKNVWVITLRKNTQLSNGEPVPDKYRPRVFEKVGNTHIDITQTKLVANGSKGVLSIDRWDGDKGSVARLKNVLVTELIEYERSEAASYEPGSEFGVQTVAEPVTEKKTAPKKTTAKKNTAADDVKSEDVPW